MYGLSPVFEVEPYPPAAEVDVLPTTGTWFLSGLGPGDSFRLLFLSSAEVSIGSSDISTYNTSIQEHAPRPGHSAIRAYSDDFKAVGCTARVDARDNTATTGTGEPIYWLNGSKVADNYADFYDGRLGRRGQRQGRVRQQRTRHLLLPSTTPPPGATTTARSFSSLAAHPHALEQSDVGMGRPQRQRLGSWPHPRNGASRQPVSAPHVRPLAHLHQPCLTPTPPRSTCTATGT